MPKYTYLYSIDYSIDALLCMPALKCKANKFDFTYELLSIETADQMLFRPNPNP